MKKYGKPEFEVTVIANNDVITDSTHDNDGQDKVWLDPENEVFGQ